MKLIVTFALLLLTTLPAKADDLNLRCFYFGSWKIVSVDLSSGKGSYYLEAFPNTPTALRANITDRSITLFLAEAARATGFMFQIDRLTGRVTDHRDRQNPSWHCDKIEGPKF